MHHLLVRMGMTARKAVLIIYGVSLVFCVLAILMTNMRDERAGLFLIIMGCGAILVVSEFLELDFIELKLCDSQCNRLEQKVPMYEFSKGSLDVSLTEWGNAMHISLPLATKECSYGTLDISRDVVQRPLTPFTLRRIEQLRRTVLDVLIRLNREHVCSIGLPN
jgi:hypothetical protein